MGFLQCVFVLVVAVFFHQTKAWGSLGYSPRGIKLPSGVAQDPLNFQQKQLMQAPVKPLTWRFPIVPEVPSEVAVNFQLRQPVTPSSVAVLCSESQVHVEVQQDMFGDGQLIQPSGLSMGGCPVVGQDPNAKVLIFEYALQDCNSVTTMTEDELVYTFSVTYTPVALGDAPITRTDSAVIGVQCHYPRLQNVSSNALMPAWVPYASTVVGEDILVFSLKLMLDDWSYERPSNVYFLGDVINIEASVKVYNHVPLRVLVDSCVATQVPDVTSLPRYSFIENHGCFVDAKLTGSSSHFVPRSQDDKLRFQLEAFMFQNRSSPSIYITCLLNATLASTPSDAVHKSCSFANGWSAADGNHQVCSCCDSTCGPDAGVAASPPFGGVQWQGMASFGPVVVQQQRL
ncbi:zona pellucida sperm-binding protein 3-like isoform X3 [Puntigrus tetrazona]|uniref:zona pellucida sperm-binding protein 3-like isoform X3 n=1 Tax=Puntigrus tetrazona TaxID=1606681 RepID=UPI001C8AA9ED|nr:zona pellucida sperm-binding protein 3-like isoform X3 [Puntigrus tetrazona]